MGNYDNEQVELELRNHAETRDAFKLGDGDNIAWCPKSQIEYLGNGKWIFPVWLAQKKGFI